MILYWFLATVLVIFAGSLFLPEPRELVYFSVYSPQPYIYMAVCTLAAACGYFSLRLLPRGKAIVRLAPQVKRYLSTRYLLFLVVVAVSGVVVLLLQINATVGLADYFVLLAASSTSATTSDIREQTIMLTSAMGGLPGFIKMFNWNSVAAPFCLLALLARGRRIRGIFNVILATTVGIVFLAGTVLRMDRLSSLALMPVIVSLLRRKDQKAVRWVAIAALVVLIAGGVFESIRRRSGQGALDWISLYLQLGTINLDLMMKSVSGHTFGLAGVFSFVDWIFKGFGIDLLRTPPLFNFAWSDAQNGFGYMYLDFGWTGPIIFLLMGLTAGWIDSKASQPAQRETLWKELQWFACYAAASLAVVPAYTGFDFWFLIMASCAYLKLEKFLPTRADHAIPKAWNVVTGGS